MADLCHAKGNTQRIHATMLGTTSSHYIGCSTSLSRLPINFSSKPFIAMLRARWLLPVGLFQVTFPDLTLLTQQSNGGSGWGGDPHALSSNAFQRPLPVPCV